MDSIVKYKSESGEEVSLSADIIKRYLVSGDPSKVTDQEVMMFLKLCQYQKLNPFLNEAYLVKFGNEKAQIIVGKDVFMRRLSNSPLVKVTKQVSSFVRKVQTRYSTAMGHSMCRVRSSCLEVGAGFGAKAGRSQLNIL